MSADDTSRPTGRTEPVIIACYDRGRPSTLEPGRQWLREGWRSALGEIHDAGSTSIPRPVTKPIDLDRNASVMLAAHIRQSSLSGRSYLYVNAADALQTGASD